MAATFTSRFYASDSDSDSKSSEDEAPVPTRSQQRWESDDEVEEKREVKSKDAKFKDELENLATKIKNALKINDWVKAEEAFEELLKTMKGKKTGKETPRTFIKAYVDLEDAVEAAWPNKKTLNKLLAKALTSLRQKVCNKVKQEMEIETVLADYRKNPDAEVEVLAAPVSTPSTTSTVTAPAPASSKRAAATTTKAAAKREEGSDDDDDDDESIDWGESEESSSDDEVERKDRYWIAADFLKVVVDKSKKDVDRVRVQGTGKTVDVEGRIASRANKTEKPIFAQGEEITVKSVLEKLSEFVSARGRRGTSSVEQQDLLNRLRQEVIRTKLSLGLDVKILIQIIVAYFDDNTSVSSHMSSERWHQCHDDIMTLLIILRHNSATLICDPTVDDDAENLSDTTRPFLVRGSVVAMIERLDDEYIKTLQSTDPHTPEYVDRLKDEGDIYNIICWGERYATKLGYHDDIANIVLRRIEHLYYKRPYVPSLPRPSTLVVDGVDATTIANDNAAEIALRATEESDVTALMARLCKTLYSAKTADRNRTRAMLCQIYHLAVYDKWFQARDLLLMSHLQESISHADASTQILYNRTMVQLGLCAFRNGMISAAQSALNDIWSVGRAKELLAQGIMQRKQEKSNDEITNEKKRQIPFHMHINIELIECVYYVSSMFMEIPNMAQGNEGGSRVISKSFRRQLDFYNGQVYTGPAENSRDHIMAAAMAMKNGDWQLCEQHILNLQIWNLCQNADGIRTMLRNRIKEESLRTFLFAFSGFYDSIFVKSLSEMFDLSLPTVHSIVSKMIISDELQASHDQPTSTIVIHKAEPSPLQSLALQFMDKVVQLDENNARLAEIPSGNAHKDRQLYGRSQRRDGNSGPNSNRSGGRYNSNSRQQQGGRQQQQQRRDRD